MSESEPSLPLSVHYLIGMLVIMKKKTLKNVSLKITDLNRYVKGRLGYAAQTGVSPYELVCRCLSLDGRSKPHGMSYKRFVLNNSAYILAQVSKFKNKFINKNDFPNDVDLTVINDSFLKTYEWRRVRMVVLNKYGSRCQCCGATPKDGAVMNVDHIKPRRLFPQLALDLNNLQILCHDCNHGKGNWDMTDWRGELSSEQVDHIQSILK